MIECPPRVRASSEQIQAILGHLGAVEARRRRLDLSTLSRDDASRLLQSLTHNRKQDVRLKSTGGRPAHPLDHLPSHQRKLIEALAADPNDSRHGTQYAYSAGRCKCAPCKAAGTGRTLTNTHSET